jgi:hypothetical protein
MTSAADFFPRQWLVGVHDEAHEEAMIRALVRESSRTHLNREKFPDRKSPGSNVF